MTESEQMTDWAEMPAPSPEVVAEWMTRWQEAERAGRIERALDAWFDGGWVPAIAELERHDALVRMCSFRVAKTSMRVRYPAVMGRPR